MKRYYRESDGDLYDRLRRRYIIVRREKIVGRMHHINEGADEVAISEHEIEEPR